MIKRYDWSWDGCEQRTRGEWVTYEDHQDTVEELVAGLKAIADSTTSASGPMAPFAITRYRAIAQALIEKYGETA